MTWALGSILVVLVGLVVLAAVTRPPVYPELEEDVAVLNRDEAEHQHIDALHTASRRFQKNPAIPMDRHEFNYYLTLAVLTKDRMRALDGLPNGRVVRKRWRRELQLDIKRLAADHDSARTTETG